MKDPKPRFKKRKKPKPLKTFDEAKSYLMWMLSRRDYSGKQLERRLKLRQFDAAEIPRLLDLMKEKGYFNEERYMTARVRELGRRGYGKQMIKGRLIGEGLKPDQKILDDNEKEISEPQVERVIEKYKRLDFEGYDLQKKVLDYFRRRGHNVSGVLKKFK